MGIKLSLSVVDHGLLSDLRSTLLVGRDGSIGWLPRHRRVPPPGVRLFPLRGNGPPESIEVYLNDVKPKAVRVELYAEGAKGGSAVRQEMKRVRRQTGASGGYIYRASLPATRPAADYTVRVIPRCEGVAIPLEDARILWQR